MSLYQSFDVSDISPNSTQLWGPGRGKLRLLDEFLGVLIPSYMLDGHKIITQEDPVVYALVEDMEGHGRISQEHYKILWPQLLTWRTLSWSK
jgi:hypothetical protein